MVCVKCRSAEARAFGRQREPLCKDCLCESVQSKFRTAFKTKGAIQPNDKVLLEADGSVESQSALNLLLLFHNPDRTRLSRGKTQFSLEILYLSNPASEDTPKIDGVVQELLSRHGGSSGDVKLIRKSLDEIKVDQFEGSLDSTAIQDLEKFHRRNAVLEYAQNANCNVLVDCQTATSIAQTVISQSCKGNGLSISSGASLFDDRFQQKYGVRIVRPLREITTSELTLYCRFSQIETYTPPLKESKTLDSLVEQFVHTLHDTFPSGVSSILSMASKLRPVDWRTGPAPSGSQKEDQERLCKLCSEPSIGYHCYSCQKHIINKMTSSSLDCL